MLILAHGFFVAGEFAIVAVERNRIEQLADEGDKRARSALAALKTLSFQLSGAQLGITLTSLILGFIIETTLGDAIEPLVEAVGAPEGSVGAIAVTLALGLATMGEMVIGELIPKNVAIADSFRLALRVATPLRFVNSLFRPLIVFLNGAANVTVRLFGIEPREELASMRSLEELQALIHSSREEGSLPEEEFSLLSRSISFGDKTAADALVPRTAVVAVRRDQTLVDLTKTARECGHSRFPVHDGDLDQVLGVAHVKDSYAIPVEDRASNPIENIMREGLEVPESRSLDSLLIEMRRTRKHLAVVIDEYGGTAGIITLEDLLEEIVGDIEDEYDPTEAATTPPAQGVNVVSGMLHPDEVRDATGFEMPEGDYETLAGFLLMLFNRIPNSGDHAVYEGWEFKVVEMEGRRISQVLVVAPPPDEREESDS